MTRTIVFVSLFLAFAGGSASSVAQPIEPVVAPSVDQQMVKRLKYQVLDNTARRAYAEGRLNQAEKDLSQTYAYAQNMAKIESLEWELEAAKNKYATEQHEHAADGLMAKAKIDRLVAQDKKAMDQFRFFNGIFGATILIVLLLAFLMHRFVVGGLRQQLKKREDHSADRLKLYGDQMAILEKLRLQFGVQEREAEESAAETRRLTEKIKTLESTNQSLEEANQGLVSGEAFDELRRQISSLEAEKTSLGSERDQYKKRSMHLLSEIERAVTEGADKGFEFIPVLSEDGQADSSTLDEKHTQHPDGSREIDINV